MTLNVNGKTVVTSNATNYSGGNCDQLKKGVSVAVTGTLRFSDGAITATSIQITKKGDGNS